MNSITKTIARITGATSVELGDVIQSLWSGYGAIQRATLHGAELHGAELHGAEPRPVIIKHIDLSETRANRRGWGGDVSHKRKVRSYQVESTFYRSQATQCDASCRVPALIALEEMPNQSGWLIVLEDLDDNGFAERRNQASPTDIGACLRWLANFHATFLNSSGSGLWPIGTYWHLATRPEEFEAMPAGILKRSAKLIDDKLNAASFQTLVHGDAKLANFCFSGDRGADVAAVDFQYVGAGCGMKDVAYFISSCLNEQQAAAQQESLLDDYFQQLSAALASRQIRVDFDALEAEWRTLYPLAWADFCRFLSGWSPGHWKLNRYSDQITRSALEQLRQE